MDKKELIREAEKKRFQQLLEFTTYNKDLNRGGVETGTLVDEADEDNNQPQDAAPVPDANAGAEGSTPDMTGGAPMSPDAGVSADPMGGADMGGGMPPMDGAADPNAAPQGDPNAQGGAPQTPQGFNPQDAAPMGGDVTPEDFEGGVNPDDEVVDVTELTDAQEETQEELKNFDAKFDKLLQQIGKWEAMVDSNNQKIEDLKAEFEKRNPTQIEKLSMQTANSYPFSQTPEQYWKDKEATSNYRTEDDDNGKEQGQYTITKNDIEGATNWKEIADSLDDDAIFHPTLKNTIGNW